ncbi:glycosyltransferase [Ktedonosporobacter rubrisoli]|uniref:Glycosyltransferase n=1 Tax=Ktedonosporobacter rubrisoli TaxID=2509675 RepID=A0A4P6JSQ8_KTERU|nr:glycosyltransferase [Ktedonosporobacter rubrisoli]QBD78325.1 glycosyltransferase [Ktedonosporobacter rubrisoli]
MTIHVSVIVPTCRRPELLARCMEALLAQDFAPTDYEIIIVDDAACPETKLQVEHRKARLCGGPQLRYIPVRGSYCTHGPAAARNVGWRSAAGQLIAFTDDDCIPSRGWLKEGVAALDEGATGASGRIVVPLTSIPTDYEYNASYLAHSEFVTANCFYRREVLSEVGGFDERFRAAWREDSDLFFTLLECGAKCVYVPDAVVTHPVRPAGWGISLYQQYKSMFNALLYKKHPTLYRQKVQATPPWHYYAIVGALLATLLASAGRPRLLTLTGLGIWTYLTGRFCQQRLEHTSRSPGHVLEMIITSILIPPLAIFWRLRGAIKFRVFFL